VESRHWPLPSAPQGPCRWGLPVQLSFAQASGTWDPGTWGGAESLSWCHRHWRATGPQIWADVGKQQRGSLNFSSADCLPEMKPQVKSCCLCYLQKEWTNSSLTAPLSTFLPLRAQNTTAHCALFRRVKGSGREPQAFLHDRDVTR
jgi:hypothetical protein